MTRPSTARVLGMSVVLLTACSSGGGQPSPAADPSGPGEQARSASPSAAAASEAAFQPLSCPDGLAVDESGALFAADVCTNRVLRYTPDEGWSPFAGTGMAGYSGDGGPAVDAELNYVGGVIIHDGDVYITECGGNVVRVVTPDGIISTVAGTGGLGAGNGGYSGDGGPATAATMACVADAALDGAGNLYMIDRENSVVRLVDASGTITTIVGGGTLDAYGPDAPAEGRPATDARFEFESPSHIAVGPDGALYLSDERGHRIWRLEADGTLTTIAGTGVAGFAGDGGPATEAQLNAPYGLAFDSAGNLFIGDYENARIRRVAPDGTITTVAGNGEVGTDGDGRPATEAQLQSPYGLAVDAAGNLYIADQENAIIRVVDPEGTIRSL